MTNDKKTTSLTGSHLINTAGKCDRLRGTLNRHLRLLDAVCVEEIQSNIRANFTLWQLRANTWKHFSLTDLKVWHCWSLSLIYRSAGTMGFIKYQQSAAPARPDLIRFQHFFNGMSRSFPTHSGLMYLQREAFHIGFKWLEQRKAGT